MKLKWFVILVVIGVLGFAFLGIYAMGGGFKGDEGIINPLPPEVVPYEVRTPYMVVYCSSYNYSGGSVLIDGFYTSAGWAKGLRWEFNDQILILEKAIISRR